MWKKISELKKTKKFYIGVTHAPEERIKDHINEKNMKTMYILCKVPTRSKTIKFERKLIYKFRKIIKSLTILNLMKMVILLKVAEKGLKME